MSKPAWRSRLKFQSPPSTSAEVSSNYLTVWITTPGRSDGTAPRWQLLVGDDRDNFSAVNTSYSRPVAVPMASNMWLQGLPLLQRMLYPGSGGRMNNPPPAPPVMTVKTNDGKTVTGKLVYRDEFTISVMDDDGWTRSWPVAAVTISGDDPLKAHVDQLGKYTDAAMHDVHAFLATLK